MPAEGALALARKLAASASNQNVYGMPTLYTSGRPAMRTNIVIDDQLMRDAMQASGARTKREAVEIGLRTLVRLEQQKRIRAFRGRLSWEGNLESLRQDQSPAEAESA
ncbi:type II toxin-antitoxin system VapB family antitoxin [Synechococcus sp. EJ6-Ellesmere]|uniref:type II toxin-antitoxin system VapB family antitoxin n=2 Tax=Synechococcus TaxID=1129 RepID=UPI0020CE32D3|nr:type II toxin-antitoxin system VapB family antitoxin [Synechococcus sp. EJ6-Ellesmere]